MRKPYKKQHPIGRFKQKIRVDPSTNCWRWQGAKRQCGHGIFTVTVEGRTVRLQAHRYALELEGIDVPDDKIVQHSCTNSDCVNPMHLFMSDEPTVSRGGTVDDRRYGSNHQNSILDDGDATIIRLLGHQQGWPASRIAATFKVSVDTVYKILSGHRRATVRESAAQKSFTLEEGLPV